MLSRPGACAGVLGVGAVLVHGRGWWHVLSQDGTPAAAWVEAGRHRPAGERRLHTSQRRWLADHGLFQRATQLLALAWCVDQVLEVARWGFVGEALAGGGERPPGAGHGLRSWQADVFGVESDDVVGLEGLVAQGARKGDGQLGVARLKSRRSAAVSRPAVGERIAMTISDC